MTGTVILVLVVVLAVAVGLVLRARSGTVKPTAGAQTVARRPAPAGRPDDQADRDVDTAEEESGDQTGVQALLRAAGLRGDGPAVVHFSATWCGPCAAVRRVVAGTSARLAAEAPEGAPVQDLELDLDEHAVLARRLRVMSLPTTFIYDAEGVGHGRISGVPDASALAEALRPLR
ncbi:thioredoxin family protein [Tomitella fengzijianii]|uniref:Thioredoxin family protein n=1 Tax=Tomitella fengzijianii TaxID=2597660 RepID=A0A516X1A9_9ACTN|nr:thioredoxin family protein [Tomitella fengzijianii]QDQ96866.1 thioredoxin family protein [Tomitella fengzijianii]